jgi:hypothetical protein
VPDEPTDFRAALSLLAEHKVRFVLIGGLAMTAQGASHITLDIDISCDLSSLNLTALATALRRCHARLRDMPPDLPFVLDERSLRNLTNMTLSTDLGNLDILAQPEGVDNFEGLWKRASVMEIFGMMVRVASVEDLIAMKRAANRPKDQLHVLELLDLQQFLRDEN